MTIRNGGGQQWFALPLGFARDAKLMTVPPATRYLFLELVALALETSSNGRVSAAQLSSCGHGMRSLRVHCGHLMDALMLRYDQEEDAYYILDSTKWLEARPQGDTKTTSTKNVSAGQQRYPTHKTEKVRNSSDSRGGAREVLQTDRQTEEGRTPSGSVRPSSAQAAPRVARGAAQPAPDPTPDEGRKLSGAEAMAQMREQIKRTQATNPNSTGRDIRFSKYDPDRPIEPINSAMKNGWTEE